MSELADQAIAENDLADQPPDTEDMALSTWWANSQPVAKVQVDTLIIADSPRLEGEDWEHVRLLAELDGELPPIMVHKPTMRVIDGVHRVRAAILNGLEMIEARLLDCDVDVAFVLAVKANVAHGLPLSQPDRVAAADRIIAAHPQWSDRAVAAATGLSDKTVGRLRDRADRSGAQPAARLGRDGRLRPLDSAAKRREAAAMINQEPGAGLRAIARATGLSLATVRDVRQRVGRGEDPVPERYRVTRYPASDRPAEKPQRREEPLPRPPAKRHRRTGAAVDRHEVLARLRNDPSLRFSETGRHTLRWLHRYTVDSEGLEGLCHNLPDHCAPVIADLALSCASAWATLAERLRERIE